MPERSPRELRIRRHLRVRKRVGGSAERPRLSIFRSNIHIYAQVIDDAAGRTLVAASSLTTRSLAVPFRRSSSDQRSPQPCPKQ